MSWWSVIYWSVLVGGFAMLCAVVVFSLGQMVTPDPTVTSLGPWGWGLAAVMYVALAAYFARHIWQSEKGRRTYLKQWAQLETTGVIIVAVVSDVSLNGHTGMQYGHGHSVILDYKYTVSGKEYDGWAAYPFSAGRFIEIGSGVQIKVDLKSPDVHTFVSTIPTHALNMAEPQTTQ